ncbi:hypothetical protein OS493_040433, partial [Desmophyllum pertusum]
MSTLLEKQVWRELLWPVQRAGREEEEEEVEIVEERQLPPQGAILVATEERGEKKCYPQHHFTRQPLTRGIGS